MRDLIGNLLVGLTWISIVLMSLATAISIGYFFYLWGSVALTINVAAWSAFVLWIKLEVVGVLLFLASIGAMLFV